MHVPEAAMHEERDLAARQDDIWRTGQIAAVEPEAVAGRKQCPTDEYLGLGPESVSWLLPERAKLLI